MPSDFSVYFTSRLMPGADTLSSLAAPPMVPVTMTARMTSTWRSVIMVQYPSGERFGQFTLKCRRYRADRQHRSRNVQRIGQAAKRIGHGADRDRPQSLADSERD